MSSCGSPRTNKLVYKVSKRKELKKPCDKLREALQWNHPSIWSNVHAQTTKAAVKLIITVPNKTTS
jgi:hypothetical protein